MHGMLVMTSDWEPGLSFNCHIQRLMIVHVEIVTVIREFLKKA